MASQEGHPAFMIPENRETRIWRYMNFAKFVALLADRSLFLSRADQLGDPYEGSYPHANERMRPEVYEGKIPVEVRQRMSRFSRWQREWTYLSCWHMNAYESAAMWKLYAATNEAVAVRSTYERLHRVLPENAYVGMVNYLDYETEWMAEGNAFYPFLHKRRSFEHEREIRVLIQELPHHEGAIAIGTPNDATGLRVPVDLETLIEAVFVAPTTADWYVRLVEQVVAKYGLASPVRRSALDGEPIY